MAEQTPETADQFVTHKLTGPVVVVDCSDWVDTSAGWTFGSFVTHKATSPAVVIDCSGWESEPAAWLEIAVEFAPGTDPAVALAHGGKLVSAIHHRFPELGLTAEDRGGVLALTPTRTGGAAVLDEVAAVIRTKLAAVPGASRGTVTVRMAG